MTIVQLEYIVALAKYKSFTVASEKLFVSQPTLSMQLQKLERELKVELFDRSSNPIKITEIGEVVITQAKKVLEEAKRVSDLVDENTNMLKGDIKLGIIPTVLPNLVPLFYKHFTTKYPEVNLFIKELKTEDLLEEIKEGNIDFGIASTPLYDLQVTEKPIFKEPIVAYVSNNSKLIKKTTLDIKEIENADLLMLEEGHCFRDNILDLCKNKDMISDKVRLEGGSFSTLISLVDEGYGMTLLPLLETDRIPKEHLDNIKYFNSAPNREISLLYSTAQVRMSFVKEFTELLKSTLRGYNFMSEQKDKKQPKLQIL